MAMKQTVRDKLRLMLPKQSAKTKDNVPKQKVEMDPLHIPDCIINGTAVTENNNGHLEDYVDMEGHEVMRYRNCPVPHTHKVVVMVRPQEQKAAPLSPQIKTFQDIGVQTTDGKYIIDISLIYMWLTNVNAFNGVSLVR